MNRIINLFIYLLYEVCLILIALVALPKVLYQFFFLKKYRDSLSIRLGINYPKIKKKSKSLTWIHAVSIGETKAIVSLARQLKQKFPENEIVVSSTTETAHKEAKRSLPFADYHVYLPLDFKFIVHKILSQASPDLVILCESDFWFNFLRTAKNRGASIALVNGKMSEKSMTRFKSAPFFSKRLLGLFDILCMQNRMYQNRFIQAVAPEEKMVVTGNLKLDEEYPQLSQEEIVQWRHKLGIEGDHLVLTIGSTHHPEEQIFINILKDIWKKVPNLKVILVPRHPERFKEVASLLAKEEINTINYTDIHHRTGQEQVILIDAMGMLRMCYQLSDIALVGGSYTSKVGGHNILEPCWYGKPVLFGPHMHTQVELVNILKEYDAGRQVEKEELKDYLLKLLREKSEREAIGKNGLRLVQEVKGSTKRTLDALEPIIAKLK